MLVWFDLVQPDWVALRNAKKNVMQLCKFVVRGLEFAWRASAAISRWMSHL